MRTFVLTESCDPNTKTTRGSPQTKKACGAQDTNRVTAERSESLSA